MNEVENGLGFYSNTSISQIPFHSAYISALEAEKIHHALVESGQAELAEIMSERAQRTDSDRRYANALELLEEGSFEVDDEPVVSASEDGAFVMVWKWVDAESAEI
jgi:hypothetical protein